MQGMCLAAVMHYCRGALHNVADDKEKGCRQCRAVLCTLHPLCQHCMADPVFSYALSPAFEYLY